MQRPVGLPVLFDGELTAEDRRNLHYCELALEGGELVTSGVYGWAMVATGIGDSIAAPSSAPIGWPTVFSFPIFDIVVTSGIG